MSIEYPCVHWNDGKCKKFSDDKVKSWCVESPCEDQMPSNADCIRAMSDEELAEDYCKFLNAMLSKVVSKYKLDFEYDMEKGKSIMLKYLQQPAEGE